MQRKNKNIILKVQDANLSFKIIRNKITMPSVNIFRVPVPMNISDLIKDRVPPTFGLEVDAKETKKVKKAEIHRKCLKITPFCRRKWGSTAKRLEQP